MNSQGTRVKVSVLMLAYNHERFIEQAVESAVMQKTDFRYEIVIGEDCSTDRTRDILLGLQSRYPDKIRLLTPEQNLGMHDNFRETLRACTGEYVAFLEGDDYWTTGDKLQKQADFLDSHKDYVACFHNVTAFYEDGRTKPWLLRPMKQRTTLTLEDLLVANEIPTCTTMFRRGLVEDLPAWVNELMMVDWPFHILNARYGMFGYLKETMAAYRIHSGGVFSLQSQARQFRSYIAMYEGLNKHLDYRYDKLIRGRIFYMRYALVLAHMNANEYEEAKRCASECLS